MKCCVLSCQSYSDRRSDAMDGITFHIFPSDDNFKQQWITKINRLDWTPTKHTKICSCHFNNADFTVTKKGLKKLKKGTLPSINLDLSLKRKLSERVKSSESPATSDLNEFLILNDSPREKKLKQEIEQFRYKEKKTGLKIRRLQMKVQRLKKKTGAPDQPAPSAETTTIKQEPNDEDNTEDCSPKHLQIIICDSSEQPTPRKKKMHAVIQYQESIIKNQNLKIRKLRSDNLRLKKRIEKIEDDFKTLQENICAMDPLKLTPR